MINNLVKVALCLCMIVSNTCMQNCFSMESENTFSTLNIQNQSNSNINLKGTTSTSTHRSNKHIKNVFDNDDPSYINNILKKSSKILQNINTQSNKQEDIENDIKKIKSMIFNRDQSICKGLMLLSQQIKSLYNVDKSKTTTVNLVDLMDCAAKVIWYMDTPELMETISVNKMDELRELLKQVSVSSSEYQNEWVKLYNTAKELKECIVEYNEINEQLQKIQSK